MPDNGREQSTKHGSATHPRPNNIKNNYETCNVENNFRFSRMFPSRANFEFDDICTILRFTHCAGGLFNTGPCCVGALIETRHGSSIAYRSRVCFFGRRHGPHEQTNSNFNTARWPAPNGGAHQVTAGLVPDTGARGQGQEKTKRKQRETKDAQPETDHTESTRTEPPPPLTRRAS